MTTKLERAGLPVVWNSTALRRFFFKIKFDSVTGCWLWTGCVSRAGYGQFRADARNRDRVLSSPHRFAFAYFRGDDLAGGELDHTCAVKRCCNPWHLEKVTATENHLRRWKRAPAAYRARLPRENCKHGHPMTPANTYRTAQGYYVCRACARFSYLAYRARRAAQKS